MLKRAPFWWGASFALLPTVAGALGVAYSGVQGISAIWNLVSDRDPPELPILLGGILYGIGLGVLLPYLLFGVAAHLMWQKMSDRHAPFLAEVEPLATGSSSHLAVGATSFSAARPIRSMRACAIVHVVSD
jgi:hypothetical protein